MGGGREFCRLEKFYWLFGGRTVQSALVDNIEVANIVLTGTTAQQMEAVGKGQGASFEDCPLSFDRKGEIDEGLMVRFFGEIIGRDEK